MKERIVFHSIYFAFLIANIAAQHVIKSYTAMCMFHLANEIAPTILFFVVMWIKDMRLIVAYLLLLGLIFLIPRIYFVTPNCPYTLMEEAYKYHAFYIIPHVYNVVYFTTVLSWGISIYCWNKINPNYPSQ